MLGKKRVMHKLQQNWHLSGLRLSPKGLRCMPKIPGMVDIIMSETSAKTKKP